MKEGATINELCSSSIKIVQKRLQRSEGEVKNVVIIDNMETNYVVQRNGHKRRASRPSHKKKQTQMGYLKTRETGTRGKREVEEVEDVQLHVRGSSKVGKSCTKQSSKLQPSDIVQCKDPAFFQGRALQERERRMLRTILTGCSQASSRTVSDLRYIGLI